MRLGLVSLGCDKNTVDSERMLAALVGEGATRVGDLAEADVILVNTCGFIDAAKEESIETLLEAGRLKEEGRCRSVVAVGCLVERYRDELEAELPEVDLFLGLRDLGTLLPRLREKGLLPEAGSRGDADRAHPGERLALGSRHVRYLKVSEGCDHGCAFCAIPLWRGRHRSFDLARLVAETQRLEAQGAVEVNLVAQDLAHYGRDRRDGTDIATLVRTLLDETEIAWFRLLYIYSAGLREPLVDLMAAEPRLLPYIDMPIQHASDTVLHRMRRPERNAKLREKIDWLRSRIDDLTLRTTVLVGFPGETDAEFRELVDFLDDVGFDRLGAFAFSPQPGTRAADSDAEPVPEDVARDRLEEVLAVQRAASAERMAEEVGRERSILVERPAAPGDPVLDDLYGAAALAADAGPDVAGTGIWIGRTAAQADDVDGVTILRGGTDLAPGTIVRARIERASDFDLGAAFVAVERPVDVGAAPGPAGSGPSRAGGTNETRGRRPLPIAGLTLESAWGR